MRSSIGQNPTCSYHLLLTVHIGFILRHVHLENIVWHIGLVEHCEHESTLITQANSILWASYKHVNGSPFLGLEVNTHAHYIDYPHAQWGFANFKGSETLYKHIEQNVIFLKCVVNKDVFMSLRIFSKNFNPH